MSKDWQPKIELWNIDDLIPYELNVKKHEKTQIAAIAAAIQRHGWDVPIVVDRDGVIIKGHGRRLAAKELCLKKVPVIKRSDLTPDQVKAARLADNRVALSDVDPEMLRAELATIEEDLTGIFDAKELEFLNADLGEMRTDAFVTDMDAVVSDQKEDLGKRADAAAKARVPLSKAFGFKDIPTTGQLAITKMMAAAELATGLKNEEALIAWADGL